MASRIVEELRLIIQSIVLFFYFKYEDEKRNSFKALLRAVLAQAIHHKSDLFECVFDECSQRSEVIIESVNLLQELAEMALGGTRLTHIVLDGLNECDKQQKKKIVSWLDKIVKGNTDASTKHSRVRVLIVSQDEHGIAGKSVPHVTLNDSPGHSEAIRTYAQRKWGKLKELFKLAEEEGDRIVEAVTRRADGKFDRQYTSHS